MTGCPPGDGGGDGLMASSKGPIKKILNNKDELAQWLNQADKRKLDVQFHGPAHSPSLGQRYVDISPIKPWWVNSEPESLDHLEEFEKRKKPEVGERNIDGGLSQNGSVKSRTPISNQLLTPKSKDRTPRVIGKSKFVSMGELVNKQKFIPNTTKSSENLKKNTSIREYPCSTIEISDKGNLQDLNGANAQLEKEDSFFKINHNQIPKSPTTIPKHMQHLTKKNPYSLNLSGLQPQKDTEIQPTSLRHTHSARDTRNFLTSSEPPRLTNSPKLKIVTPSFHCKTPTPDPLPFPSSPTHPQPPNPPPTFLQRQTAEKTKITTKIKSDRKYIDTALSKIEASLQKPAPTFSDPKLLRLNLEKIRLKKQAKGLLQIDRLTP